MDKTQKEIEAWLVARLSKLLGIAAQRIDVEKSLTRYGLDSIVAFEVMADLEEWLQQPMPESLMWDKPGIRAIARYLSGSETLPGVDDSFAPQVTTVTQMAPQLSHLEEGISQGGGVRDTAAFSNTVEPIAIIGIGCRLPEASTPEAFWQLLHNGMETLTEVPSERWDAESLYSPDPAVAGKMVSRRGSFLKNIDLFDPHFFKISPREAAHIDPQQRLLLEVAWEALEHAGQAPDKLAGSSAGIFIGISTNDYIKNYYANLSAIDAYTNTGNAHSIAASRLSYFLDLHGPSIAIDTACSSSLVAIHLACQSLRSGEATVALAGGVNVILSPDSTISFSKARMMSASGRCRPFDADADGLVRGEGCAIVVLKRLTDAYADGNRILALIRGSAVNQDGRGNGLTAPNANAQQAVIRQALKQAGVAPSQLGYVVGQGTGTPLGDTVEIQALVDILNGLPTGSHRCALSSVKANIGHLEAAAGVTSVIAAVLALQKEEIPPQLHFQHLHPRVSFEASESSPLFIPVAPEPWLKGTQPRFSGVSAFSISGTNAHIVLEEAPAESPVAVHYNRPLHLLTLSAHDESALHDLVGSYKRYLASTSAALPDICFTANSGRAHFSARVAAVADTRDRLLNILYSFNTEARSTDLFTGNVDHAPPRVAFLFSGEGTEYERMGRELYKSQPIFQAALQQCAAILGGELEESLISALYPTSGSSLLLQKSIYAQPALFALEYALVQVWRSWGIVPDAVLGIGVGSYTAACIAGALSLEDALRLVFERARLLQTIAQSDRAMMIPTSEAQIRYIYPPSSSAMYSDALVRAANIVPHEKLSLPFISTLTGESLFPGDRLSVEYWRQQLSEPVRFTDSIETLARQGIRFFLEVGPSSTLCTLGQSLPSHESAHWLPCMSQEPGSTWQTLLTSLGTLYINGATIDWLGFDACYSHRRVSLPTYPFQRERCWITPVDLPIVPEKQEVSRKAMSHPLLGRQMRQEI